MYHLSTDQQNFAKWIVASKTSFAGAAKSKQLNNQDELAFGQKGGPLYNYIRTTVVPSDKKSLRAFQRGSHRAHWKPLPEDYNPLDWLQKNPYLRKLTKDEYNRQAYYTPQKVSSMNRPFSDTSTGGSTSSTVVRSDGDGGHVYIAGTLETILKLDEDNAQKLFDEAKTLSFGQNESLLRMWVMDLPSVKIETNDHNTQAISLTIFDVSLNEYKMYRVGFGGPDCQYLFVQVPSVTSNVYKSIIQVCATLQHKTTSIQENCRNDGYSRQMTKLMAEGTRVYVVKAPNEYSMDNIYFQEQSKLKFKGDLTARRTLIEFVRNDNFGSNKLEDATNTLSSAGWSEEDVSKLIKSHIINVSWQVPVKCELDKINGASDDDASDDEDLFAEANERKATSDHIEKSLTPKKRGDSLLTFMWQKHSAAAFRELETTGAYTSLQAGIIFSSSKSTEPMNYGTSSQARSIPSADGQSKDTPRETNKNLDENKEPGFTPHVGNNPPPLPTTIDDISKESTDDEMQDDEFNRWLDKEIDDTTAALGQTDSAENVATPAAYSAAGSGYSEKKGRTSYKKRQLLKRAVKFGKNKIKKFRQPARAKATCVTTNPPNKGAQKTPHGSLEVSTVPAAGEDYDRVRSGNDGKYMKLGKRKA